MTDKRFESYKTPDYSAYPWNPSPFTAVLHPVAEPALQDLEGMSVEPPTTCDKFLEGYQKCVGNSLDPRAQCRTWLLDHVECRRGTLQEAYLSRYRQKVSSMTLREKNEFRNQWHDKYFKGSYFATVDAIRKEQKF